MKWECPECGYCNPDNIIRCVCGYEKFKTGQFSQNYGLDESKNKNEDTGEEKGIVLNPYIKFFISLFVLIILVFIYVGLWLFFWVLPNLGPAFV